MKYYNRYECRYHVSTNIHRTFTFSYNSYMMRV